MYERANTYKLGQMVYHEDIYDCGEIMKVVGIRATELELYGDYSGGTHSVRQTSWMSISGVYTTPNSVGR